MNIWIDGSPGKRQNPEGRIAIVFEEGQTIVEEVGVGTNNEIEYRALIEALRNCNNGDVINTDSQLLVGHLIKGWRVGAENLKDYYNQAKKLL